MSTPGWKGNLTLELSNVANLPIALYFGMRIGQISFLAMSGPVERPYGSSGLGSKYQGQSTPTASESFRDFEAGRRTRKGGPQRTGALEAMTIGHTVDWRADLGGGVTVALVQAGTFRSDAGTVFGPVPRLMWEDLVADELIEGHSLTQALNCLLIETPGGRVLVETGIGERMDDHHRAQRHVTGVPILPALRAAGFDPVDGRRHRPQPPPLRPRRRPADRRWGAARSARARVVAQAVEWDFALGSNPRLAASYEQDELRLVEPWARPMSADGDEELVPGVHGAAHQRSLRRPPGDHRPWSRPHRRLHRRPLHAAVEREPALGRVVRRLPAHERRGQGRDLRGGGCRRLDDRALARAASAGRAPAGERGRYRFEPIV